MMGERGSGRTTQQMLDAPQGAIYVWCNGELRYPRELAKSLGRKDLLIHSRSCFRDGRLRGIRKPIILDHAVLLSPREYDEFLTLNRYNNEHN